MKIIHKTIKKILPYLAYTVSTTSEPLCWNCEVIYRRRIQRHQPKPQTMYAANHRGTACVDIISVALLTRLILQRFQPLSPFSNFRDVFPHDANSIVNLGLNSSSLCISLAWSCRRCWRVMSGKIRVVRFGPMQWKRGRFGLAGYQRNAESLRTDIIEQVLV